MTTPLHHRLLRGIAPLLLLSAAGCLGGQVGEEQVVCAPIERQPLALDQASPLGFTGQELLDAAAGSSEADVSWADGRAWAPAPSSTDGARPTCGPARSDSAALRRTDVTAARRIGAPEVQLFGRAANAH